MRACTVWHLQYYMESFVGRASVCACMVSHPHYPLPRTKLASLVKGEVLSPEKIRATTGGIALHPPASPSPQPSQKDNNPSPRTMSLPPLSKVRCCRSKKIGQLPEGLPQQPLATHQPIQNRTILLSFRRGVFVCA